MPWCILQFKLTLRPPSHRLVSYRPYAWVRLPCAAFPLSARHRETLLPTLLSPRPESQKGPRRSRPSIVCLLSRRPCLFRLVPVPRLVLTAPYPLRGGPSLEVVLVLGPQAQWEPGVSACLCETKARSRFIGPAHSSTPSSKRLCFYTEPSLAEPACGHPAASASQQAPCAR